MVILMTAVGCEEQKKPPVVDQAALDAADRIAKLQAQLDKARKDRTADQDRIRQLQAEIDRLNRELAAKPVPKPAPEGWTAVPGGAMISIEGTILFDSGKAILKTTGKPTLNSIAATIQEKYPNHEIYVFGHTDTDPIRYSKWVDNYELSCQRALTVLRHLISQGLGNHIAACGWGESRPAADNVSAESKRMNRRVQIFAMEPEEKAAGSPPSGKQMP